MPASLDVLLQRAGCMHACMHGLQRQQVRLNSSTLCGQAVRLGAAKKHAGCCRGSLG